MKEQYWKITSYISLGILALYLLIRKHIFRDKKSIKIINKSKRNKQLPHNARKISITGGKLSGKSTAISYIYQKLINLSFNVLIVPQSLQMFMSCGGSDLILQQNQKQQIVCLNRIKLQIALQECFQNIAKLKNQNDSLIIVCDKSLIDIIFQFKKNVWKGALNKLGVSQRELISESSQNQLKQCDQNQRSIIIENDRKLRVILQKFQNVHQIKQKETINKKLQELQKQVLDFCQKNKIMKN